MPFLLWFDWTWLILIPAFIITIWAQARVSSAYKKYSEIPAQSGVTGREFAQTMLTQNNIDGVRVQAVQGQMTDHFDPRNNTVSLSEGVYNKHSVAAVSIAAHECGHVLQRFKKYGPMRVRNAIVPVVNVATSLAFPLILIGLLFRENMGVLVDIGAWVYFAVVIFQLITLPVEFNASKRAMENIQASGVLTVQEQGEAKKMLSAAAMTYVAAMLASFLSFLRLFLLSRRR
ncbi:MAG: zinc metallopeptidase [Christensenella sp.]|uniref:zinc metallopeptidase n=1 Tax=Christensenella sp. TaxID=1935934 RepID=UPI002B21B55C|nr:zinc metallopeptidase [Christensenella sp.]MEA5002234.1 zinc metallopeptidase [Christensenella sp.]